MVSYILEIGVWWSHPRKNSQGFYDLSSVLLSLDTDRMGTTNKNESEVEEEKSIVGL